MTVFHAMHAQNIVKAHQTGSCWSFTPADTVCIFDEEERLVVDEILQLSIYFPFGLEPSQRPHGHWHDELLKMRAFA